ncbi:winged helix-turn-helix domain-containing protein [Microbacterium protaetiae]|uniref:Winged helix-turn-helix domain-containing protein n=1 Tax=Microbacterium protaetiae TaxID=2509458 RepID=A0A4P6EGP9_9MICO|nr:winged helix-turn-helix domain-containing protein [Microbacterium protaetiae]
MHELTRDQARRIIVRAQLLDADRPGDVVEVAEQLGYLKIDPTAVIAPCEHTTLWSRIGWSYETGQLKKAVEDDRLLFELDGAYRPTSLLPLMRAGMRRWPQHAGWRQWMQANEAFAKEVVARLRAEGPLRAEQIPDTAAVMLDTSDGWYGPNQVPRMLEALSRQGVVAVTAREGRVRVWDVAERVFPQDLPAYPDDEADRMLRERRLQAAGLAKQNSPWTRVGDAGEAARVEGSTWKWRVDPQALERVDDEVDGRVALLNPYDGMLADRPRLKEVFEFEFVLEQFKPKAQRVYGYFAHPILMGDRFVGLLDAAVDKKEGMLRVDAIHELIPLEPEEMEMIRAEIAELAQWLGVPVAEQR